MKIYSPRLLSAPLLVKIKLRANPVQSKNTNLGVPIILNFAILSTDLNPKAWAAAGRSRIKNSKNIISIETVSGTKRR